MSHTRQTGTFSHVGLWSCFFSTSYSPLHSVSRPWESRVSHFHREWKMALFCFLTIWLLHFMCVYRVYSRLHLPLFLLTWNRIHQRLDLLLLFCSWCWCETRGEKADENSWDQRFNYNHDYGDDDTISHSRVSLHFLLLHSIVSTLLMGFSFSFFSQFT